MIDKLTAIRKAIKLLESAGLSVTITDIYGMAKCASIIIADESITITHSKDGTATIGVAEVTNDRI